MIFHLFKYELRRYFRSNQSRTFILSVVLMLCASMFLSFRDYQLAYSYYQENLHQNRLNWESQTEKDPHDAAHDGTYVIKPLHPLMLLDNGIQPYVGQVIHLGAHERKQSSLNQAKDQAGVYRFGVLNPGFILIYIFPLLIIFLGYNSFTQEKETQTIRLALAQGASIRKLAMGKWLALMLQMMFLLFLFFGLAGIFYYLLDREIEVGVLEWISFGLMYVLYFIVFINVVLLTSILAKSSGTSLTVLLTIWILITLIIPKFSTNLAGYVYPFPTYQEFRENIYKDQQSGLNGHNFWNEAAQDFQQKVLKEYGVKTIEELPVAYSGLLLAEGEKYESAIYTKHFNLLRIQYQNQRSIYRLNSIMSPFLPVRFVSMALSRSDYGFQWHFEDEAEKYRVDFNTMLNMNIAKNAKGIEAYKASDDFWRVVPEFQYQWQSFDEILHDHLAEYLTIFLWAVLSFIGMLLMSNKLKVV